MANFNFNKVILAGRLTADPELKYTQAQIPITMFTVAVNRAKTKDGTVKADFISCTAWRSTAELVCRYFRKGSSIAVVGSISTDKYTDKDGNTRIRYDVQVEEVSFVDSKNEAQGTNNEPTYNPYQTSENIADVPNFEANAGDDDLPF